jgi:glycosyltransferase involved in cell wall biosynthesis
MFALSGANGQNPGNVTHVVFNDVVRRISFNASRADFVIGFVGSYSKVNKRQVDVLVKIARKLENLNPNIKFIVIGGISTYGSAYATLPNNVFFLGFQRDLSNTFSRCDAFFLADVQATGVEVKALTYRSFGRPVFVIAGSAQADYEYMLGDLMVLCSDEDDASDKILRLASAKKLVNS